SPTPTATPQISNMSGDYTGTVTDSGGGTRNSGTVNSGLLAQQGSNAGGVIVSTQSGGPLNLAMSLNVSSSNAVTGSMVADYADQTTCTYSVTGTYTNTGTPPATLNGSYTAVTGCTGVTGTFALTQQCTDTVTPSDRRVMNVPAAC
ncbi:MAG TPA: hypothetical protein VIO32_05005, partial [Candidatus Baltobacteraceae bacterium]